MTLVRRCTIPVLVALAAAAGPTAIAQASDSSLVKTIIAQEPELTPSKALSNAGTEIKHDKSALPKVLKLINAYEVKLVHSANVVAAVTPSSARGRAGQTAWVSGVRDIAREYRQIAAELHALERGDSATAKADLAAAEKSLDAGRTQVAKAEKLLSKLSAG